MFASTKINNKLSLPILIGGLLCASLLLAQEQGEQPLTTKQGSDSRHLDRMGEASPDEWDMDLALPQAAPVVETTSHDFSLPDAEQNRRLQQILSKMGSDPGNIKTLA